MVNSRSQILAHWSWKVKPYEGVCTFIVLGTARMARAVAIRGDDAHSAGAGVSHKDGAVAEAGNALNRCGEQRLGSVPVHVPRVCALARQGVDLTYNT